MKVLFFLLISTVSMHSIAIEIEPIVISSKFDHKKSDILSSVNVYKVNSSDESSSARVTDILDKIPGLEISKSGLMGGTSGVFIRGQESRHTVILINGVKVYDPTSTSRTFNINTLNIGSIEKIEVLKGSQSVLYGSDAIGGVINIITEKSTTGGAVQISGGYYSEIAASNTSELGAGLLRLNAFTQESNFESESSNGSEKDKSTNQGIDLQYSKEVGKHLVDSEIKFSRSFSNVDEYDYTANETIDDKTSNSSDEFIQYGVQVDSKINRLLKIKSSFNHGRYIRKVKYLDNLDYKDSNYYGSLSEYEVRANLRQLMGPIVMGIHVVSESYSSDDISTKFASINDIFLNKYIQGRKNFYEFGSRLTSSDKFGDHLVYGIGVGRKIGKKHTVKFNQKSGFKAPSVYQLRAGEGSYGPVGNPDLGPEKSISNDISYNFIDKNKSAGVSIFYNEVHDFIDFESGLGYVNDSFGIYRGMEISGGLDLENYRFDTSLTLLNISLSNGEEAQRRPDFSYVLSGTQKINDQHSVGLDWNWRGRRFERINSETFKLSPYDVMDINYSFSKNRTEVLASIQNIFDREYEIGRGYSVLRRALELSVKYKF